MKETVVVAIGGNALVKDNSDSIHEQYQAICDISSNIADMVETGVNVVVTHGNGPQVGFSLRRSEIANEVAGMYPVPLVNCVADTQGGIGYQIQQALNNEFIKRGLKKKTATIITQVQVNSEDPSFKTPTKPVGSFFDLDHARELKEKYPDWVIAEDSGRGYRRLVPSPKPVDIIEKDIIKTLIESDYVVIAVGGGGVPVIKTEDNTYKGIDAVIDKDFATSLLAEQIDAKALIVTTGVPSVYINFGKPEQKEIKYATVEEIKKYVEEGHFPEGSMLPKIEASINFLDKRERKVIITNPENLKEAIDNNAGTHIIS